MNYRVVRDTNDARTCIKGHRYRVYIYYACIDINVPTLYDCYHFLWILLSHIRNPFQFYN